MEKSNYDIVQEWLNAFAREMERNTPYLIEPFCEWYIRPYGDKNIWFADNFSIIKCEDGFQEPAICLFPSFEIIDANWVLEHMKINEPIHSLVHLPTDKSFWRHSFYLHFGL